MENLCIMQCFETSGNLNEYTPYLIFRDVLFVFGMSCNFLEQVAVIWVLHDNAI